MRRSITPRSIGLRLALPFGSTLLAVAACALPAFATSNGLVLETVSDYSWWATKGHVANCQITPAHPNGCNTNANNEGAGLWTALTAPGTLWTPTHWYYDGNVWDTDFTDPERADPAADDTGNFDPPGTALAVVIAHGNCEDVSATRCQTDQDCGLGAYCPGEPAVAGLAKTCITESIRHLYTASSESSRGNIVYYGAEAFQPPATFMAFGEDAASGTFGNAGLNGGANVSIIVNSCGMRTHYVSDLLPFFAGVHMLFMEAPTASYIDGLGNLAFSDAYQWSARGTTLANFILTNTNAPASDAWLNPTMSMNGYTALSSSTANNPLLPPALGAQAVIVSDATWPATLGHLTNETWLGTTLESNDATGNNYWGVWFACNYDCATIGF
jgi:hypothetical protein